MFVSTKALYKLWPNLNIVLYIQPGVKYDPLKSLWILPFALWCFFGAKILQALQDGGLTA